MDEQLILVNLGMELEGKEAGYKTALEMVPSGFDSVLMEIMVLSPGGAEIAYRLSGTQNCDWQIGELSDAVHTLVDYQETIASIDSEVGEKMDCVISCMYTEINGAVDYAVKSIEILIGDYWGHVEFDGGLDGVLKVLAVLDKRCTDSAAVALSELRSVL